jgi:hypothetical protein
MSAFQQGAGNLRGWGQRVHRLILRERIQVMWRTECLNAVTREAHGVAPVVVCMICPRSSGWLEIARRPGFTPVLSGRLSSPAGRPGRAGFALFD